MRGKRTKQSTARREAWHAGMILLFPDKANHTTPRQPHEQTCEPRSDLHGIYTNKRRGCVGTKVRGHECSPPTSQMRGFWDFFSSLPPLLGVASFCCRTRKRPTTKSRQGRHCQPQAIPKELVRGIGNRGREGVVRKCVPWGWTRLLAARREPTTTGRLSSPSPSAPRRRRGVSRSTSEKQAGCV